jgi:hypothetical protein
LGDIRFLIYWLSFLYILKTKSILVTFKRPSPYRAVNTLRLSYTNLSVNAV